MGLRVVVLALVLTACTNSQTNTIGLGPRTRTSAALVGFNSCDTLLQHLRQSLAEQTRVQLLQTSDQPRMLANTAAAPSADAAPPAAPEARKEGTDYSGTNNQETGVDEADFTKTDGYFIYTLNGRRLEILGTPVVGQLEKVSSTPIEGDPVSLLLSGDKAVVFSSVNPPQSPTKMLPFRNFSGFSKISVFDLSVRATPKLQREIYIEGYFSTARLAQRVVRSVSFDWRDIPGVSTWPQLPEDFYLHDRDDDARRAAWQNAVQQTIASNNAVIGALPLSAFVPMLLERHGDDYIEHAFTERDCADFVGAQDGLGRGVTSVLSLNLFDDELAVEATHILSNNSIVYASTNDLVIAEPAQDWWWYWNNDQFDEATNLHRFDIRNPGKAVYTGSGRVPGTVRDQFALSEYQGTLRVSSTTGQWNRWWMKDPTPPSNHVFVLEGQNRLAIVGSIGGIAEGEMLWASRFINDKAYLVTFRNTDPLWTIDLSDKTNPRIIGALQVPGVSTYIHPVGEHHLLTIGYGGDATNVNWSSQISLYDVSDFAHPKLLDELGFAQPAGDGWSSAYSEATWEHKAFTFWSPLSMLAVPMSTFRNQCNNVGVCSYDYQSVLQLVNVDVQNGKLSKYGSVDHSQFFNAQPGVYWGYTDIRRSIFMNDRDNCSSIYAISDKGVTANKIIPGLPRTAAVALAGYEAPVSD